MSAGRAPHPQRGPLPYPSMLRAIWGTVGQRSYLVKEMFQAAMKFVLLVGWDAHVTGQLIP